LRERAKRIARAFKSSPIGSLATANSFPFVVHIIWFVLWIAFNTLSSRRFDVFPFNLLTMVVSLEAILLTSFVLISQHHLTLLSIDGLISIFKVNLLPERELTAILEAVCLMSDKIGVDIRIAPLCQWAQRLLLTAGERINV
jgi:uncharacterized membrane protein